MEHFRIDFSGYADGTTLEAGSDFARALPSGGIAEGLKAIYQTDGAQAGASGVEAIYRVASFGTGGQHDYKLKGALDWLDAGGTSRLAGLGVRVSEDGAYGYFAIVDSALGVPVVSLYRRFAGAMNLLATASLAPLGTADLDGALTLQVRVATKSDGVHLLVRDATGGTDWLDELDASDDRIENVGFCAIYFGATSADDDVRYDDLVAEDFEDEAEDPAKVAVGIALVVNGTYLAEYQWKAMGLAPLRAVVSYVPVGPVAEIADLNDAHQPALRAGDRVAVLLDGVTVAEGVLRRMDQQYQPPEGCIYDVIGAREIAADVPIRDPVTGGGVLGWNMETDADLYTPTRQGKSVGQAIAQLEDAAADGELGLRAKGAAPSSGALYDPAETALLDAKIPHMAASGNVLQGEETLVGYMPSFAFRLDPETRVRHLVDRSVSPFRTISFDALHALPTLTTDITKNATVVIIRGAYAVPSQETFTWDSASPDATGSDKLLKDWQTGLQTQVEENKKWVFENSFLVTGYGMTGGNLYVDLDLSSVAMATDEWRGCDAIFYGFVGRGGSIEQYRIKTNNNTGRVVLVSTSWDTAHPEVGDRVGLRSAVDTGGLENGFDALGRAFTLPDGKTIAGGLCADATVKQTVANRTRTYKVKVKVRNNVLNPDTQQAYQRLMLERTGVIPFDDGVDTGALGLFNFPAQCAANSDGNVGLPDSIELTLTVVDPANPKVPEVRAPVVHGFEGTAFSFDAARWGTLKGAGDGDPGCTTPLIIEDANLTDLALQGDEFQKYAQSVLDYKGALARSGSCAIAGLDATWAVLDRRLRFTDARRALGAGALALETATDIWLTQVEFDFEKDQTVVSYGTGSANDVKIDVYRQRFAEKTRLDVQKAILQRLQETEACLRGGSDGAVPADSPLTTPSCKVTHTGSDGTTKRLDKVVNSDLKPADCPAAAQSQNCQTAPCGTITNPAQPLANASALNGFMSAAASKALKDILCAFADHIEAIWTNFGSILASHDVELHKTAVDLASVRTNLDTIVYCFNGKVVDLCAAINAVDTRVTCLATKVKACFGTVAPGAGVVCTTEDCVPAPCDVHGSCVDEFTEHVCEDACPTTIANLVPA